MTDITGTTSKHPTLGANAVDRVTLTDAVTGIEVLNRAPIGGEPLWVRFGADPTVAGDNTYVVPASTSLPIPMRIAKSNQVRVISAGAIPYSVTALIL